MQTKTVFLSKSRFISFSAWTDHAGAFVLWPSIWVVSGVRHGLDVTLSRATAGLAYWRIQVDLGVYHRLSSTRSLDWRSDGLDDLLQRMHDSGVGDWTRADLESILRTDPNLYTLVALGGRPNDYVMCLLVEKIKREGRPAPVNARPSMEGLGQT